MNDMVLQSIQNYGIDIVRTRKAVEENQYDSFSAM